MSANGDADIFNYLLNLEYLEAEFYLLAETGRGLAAGEIFGIGLPGGVSGGREVPFHTPAIATLASLNATEHRAHVRFLQSALGSSAVARPDIEFTRTFTRIAFACGLITARQVFDPFADEISFLIGAYMFEGIGLVGYAGAVNRIENHAVRSYASSVHATEAAHVSNIRSLLQQLGVGPAVTDIETACTLALGAQASQPEPTKPAQAFRRSTSQVLNALYLGHANGGGFFPNRMNGRIA